MNKITIQGIIKDIEFSHYINDIEYYKANVVVKRENDKEDIIPIKFKRFCNIYKDGDEIVFTGNVRTFSTTDENGKNHVMPYVFTYFDKPENLADGEMYDKGWNKVELDGNICKKGELRKTKTGLDVIDFIIANNIKNSNSTFNAYLPVVAWGKQAKEINKLEIGDYINIKGSFVSRTYKKRKDDDFVFNIAYEINAEEIKREE